MLRPIPTRTTVLSLGCIVILAGMIMVRGFHEPKFDLARQTGVDDAAVCTICVLPAVASLVAIFIPRLPASIHLSPAESAAPSPSHEVLLSHVVRGPPRFVG